MSRLLVKCVEQPLTEFYFMKIWDDKKLQNELSRILPENLIKFHLDLQKLIRKARKEDYDSFNF